MNITLNVHHIARTEMRETRSLNAMGKEFYARELVLHHADGSTSVLTLMSDNARALDPNEADALIAEEYEHRNHAPAMFEPDVEMAR